MPSIMRWGLASSLALSVSPGFAEVCDKVRPLWDPASGRVNFVTETLLFFASPGGLICLALIVTVIAVQSQSLPVFLAALFLIFATVDSALFKGDPVREYALREGCVTDYHFTTLMIVLASSMLLLSYLRFYRKSERNGREGT